MWSIQNSEEKSALSGILSQVSSIADKLEAGNGSRLGDGSAAVMNTAEGAVPPAADPLMGMLDGLYDAVLKDEGLRDLLAGEECPRRQACLSRTDMCALIFVLHSSGWFVKIVDAQVQASLQLLLLTQIHSLRCEAAGRRRDCRNGQLLGRCPALRPLGRLCSGAGGCRVPLEDAASRSPRVPCHAPSGQ